MSASRHAACVSLPISYDVKQLERGSGSVCLNRFGPGEVAAYMGRILPRQHPFFALLQISGLTTRPAVFRANRTLTPIVSA